MKPVLIVIVMLTAFASQAQAAYLICKSKEVDSYWSPIFKASMVDSKDHFMVRKGDDMYASLDCTQKFMPNESGQSGQRGFACKGSKVTAVIVEVGTKGVWRAELREATSKTTVAVETLDCREIQF